MTPPAGRTCTRCGKYKDASQFSWLKGRRRLKSRCLECRRHEYRGDPEKARQRAKEYYWANREEVAQKDRQRREERPEVQILQSARRRARRLGLPCTLTEQDVAVPDVCPVLGMPLVVNRERVGPDSPTLDRIIPEKGYVPGNVVVVSHRANTIKSDASVPDLFRVASFYAAIVAEEVS